MGVFDEKNKKKKFAFIDSEVGDNSNKNLESEVDFVQAGRGEKKTFSNYKGRPKIAEHKKRQKQIIVYLTQDEKDEIEKMAEKLHLTTSQFIVMKIFQ
ncbi:hypothetical protein OFO01_07360 [Campylobacter sp. JMF_01 NE2]|uniref:plasmid mobilization protein n=1 Tax=unclassified Campylobacter TaxID=2593542 RepID=UPI0022E9E109|nr:MULTISPECIES: hypothetical protein [unclassified Campylobacter]MDA3053218.1 hypothetical protein [Campylobacter sp. JMF_03 NE3]MDA3067599.1 hypothetical protein [Campylobacter sp. JMF_01 NE2]